MFVTLLQYISPLIGRRRLLLSIIKGREKKKQLAKCRYFPFYFLFAFFLLCCHIAFYVLSWSTYCQLYSISPLPFMLTASRSHAKILHYCCIYVLYAPLQKDWGSFSIITLTNLLLWSADSGPWRQVWTMAFAWNGRLKKPRKMFKTSRKTLENHGNIRNLWKCSKNYGNIRKIKKKK